MLATSWFLFGCASLGHAALVMHGVNWMHGISFPHRLLGYLKWTLLGLIPLGWCYFAWSFSYPLEELQAGAHLGPLSKGYLVTTVCAGLAFPFIIVTQYLTRRPPPALASNHNRVLDVAAELGYRPEGCGKFRLMTRLPGNESLLIDLSEKVLHLPRLPAALDGLTILHLSDLHFVGVPDKAYHQKVMDLCRAWEPDLVALTGDLVDTYRHHSWIVPVLGRLRWKVAGYAVLGNHDQWYDVPRIQRRLRRLGFRLIGNRWEKLVVRGQPILVIGNEAPWVQPAPDLGECPSDLFRLCLSHTPDNIYWAQANDIDLMVAGHVHGGQIQLPIIGPIHVPSRYGRRFANGVFEHPPTVMHVSRGVAGEEPLRYNCKPEATRIILRKRDPAVGA